MGLAEASIHLPSLTVNTVFFFIIAGIAALAAIGVVAFNSPIRSALCLVANFVCLAILYFTLNAEFLGIAQIVVYTGAIMVLFLFVIMLLNLGAPNALKESRDLKRIVGGVFALALFGVIFYMTIWPMVSGKPNFVPIDRSVKPTEAQIAKQNHSFSKIGSKDGAESDFDARPSGYNRKDLGSPENIGKSLLTDYVWPFEMVSVLLLVGIVGSILLVKRRTR